MWKLYPLDLGDTFCDKSERLNGYRPLGEEINGKLMAWYLTDGIRHAMIDAGTPPIDVVMEHFVGTNPARIEESQTVAAQLNALGVSPAQIEYVFLTHLHWDHVGALTLFENAQIFVSSAELRYWVDPEVPLHRGHNAPPGQQPPYLAMLDQIETLPMEYVEVTDGITMFPTPGHTVGHMSVAVDTDAGTYVCTGDAVHGRDNLVLNNKTGLPYTPTGNYVNIIEMWKSFERIMEMAGDDIDHVLPGHDEVIFTHTCYPPNG